MNPEVPPLPTLPSQKNKYQQAAFVLGVLFVLALAFGIWAFSSRQSIKTQANSKLATASSELSQAQAAQTAADTANKAPYKTFSGPASYGSVSFKYPKSWSAYVDQTASNEPINGYYYPGQVPGISSGTAYALRVELVSNDYDSVLSQFNGSIEDGSLKAKAYITPKMKKVANAIVGTMLTGEIGTSSDGTPQNGEMVILKVRDQTLQVYTQSTDYLKDFANVLNSLTYKP